MTGLDHTRSGSADASEMIVFTLICLVLVKLGINICRTPEGFQRTMGQFWGGCQGFLKVLEREMSGECFGMVYRLGWINDAVDVSGRLLGVLDVSKLLGVCGCGSDWGSSQRLNEKKPSVM